jgi:hypothetical protein
MVPIVSLVNIKVIREGTSTAQIIAVVTPTKIATDTMTSHPINRDFFFRDIFKPIEIL